MTDSDPQNLPGTGQDDMALVKFEALSTETSAEFKLGDTVQVSGAGIICGDKDEIKKDKTGRKTYWVRLDGVTLT